MELIINLLLVLLLASLAGGLVNRLGYPAILGELLVGIIFGPLGPIESLRILEASHDLELLAEVGVFLLLLYIGMEVNFRDLVRGSGPALLAAAGGFITPALGGYVLVVTWGYPDVAGVVIGLTLGVTSLAVLSRILVDLKLLGTRVANVMIASSVISDTAALIGFGALLSLAGEESIQLGAVALSLGKAVLFFGVTIAIGLKVLPLVGKALTRFGVTERKMNFSLVLVVGLVFAWLAELAGLHSILGAFIAGMFMRGEVMKRRLSYEVTEMVHDISLGFLAPIFFVLAGFHVDLGLAFENWRMLAAVVALGMVGKTIGTMVLYYPSSRNWREALTIGAGMNGHGAVEIIIAEIAFEMGYIGKDLFSIIVLMSFITTALVPVFLKGGVRWLRVRNELARADENRKGILIAGASPLARMLAEHLSKSSQVILIDRNRNHYLTARSMGLKAFHGNAVSEETMTVLDAATARMYIAMTQNAQVDRLALEHADELFGIPELFALPQSTDIDKDDARENAFPEGVQCLFPEDWNLANWDQWISRRQTVDTRMSISEEISLENFFKQCAERKTLPLAVERDGKMSLLREFEKLVPGDEVVGIVHNEPVVERSDPFFALIQSCPVMDFPTKLGAKELFRQVSEKMSERVGLPAEKIYKLLVKREMESTTVLVPGLAVPHIMVNDLPQTEILVARCREGVAFFESETEARLVFVLVGPKDERNLHLRILSAIAQIFQVDGLEDSLLSVEHPEGLRDILLSAERKRF